MYTEIISGYTVVIMSKTQIVDVYFTRPAPTV